MSKDNLNAYNIADLRAMAQKRVPKFLWEFVDRGTEDEVALRNNRAAFERIKLRPRVLNDVSKRSQEVTLYGKKHGMPLAIAPTGITSLMWHDGEIHLARAAKEAGIPCAMSTSSLTGIERVAKEAGGTLWFQLYMWQDRKLTDQLVLRAKAAGFEGLIVTVDAAVGGNREYNHRNGFEVVNAFKFNPTNVSQVLARPRWLVGVYLHYLLTTGPLRRENYPAGMQGKITNTPALKQDGSFTWDDIRRLRALWPGKLMVKGILNGKDAALAADCGADGVVVSNHGGRQLDGSMAPIEVLPEVVDAVGNRVTVICDSGFRRGSDVVKALAIGAKTVLVGRPTLYGTAVGGYAGAARAIEIFHEEIDRMLALLGCRNIGELTRDHLKLPS